MSSERILIHAPFGRDGTLLSRALLKQQLTVEVCARFEDLCDSIAHGAGAILIGDEALGPAQVLRLSEELKTQPAWSDLGVLVMTSSNAASQRRIQSLEPLQGPITFLERPLRIVTLVSAVRSTLRSRRRQYQIRDLLQRETENAVSLQNAIRLLQQSNDSLAEFAYAAGHDLKEPLRTITSYTQLLSRRYKGRLDEDADEYLRFASEGAMRMSALIEDLLQYAQVTGAKLQVQQAAESALAVAAVKKNLAALIKETGATISHDVLPSVGVDPTQLVQLFQNLIGNAIKYRRQDEPPEIEISAEHRDQYWLFSVADNGIGFEQEYAEQVFGVFKRLNGSDVSGTGIGLAICKRIVELYGGRIWAESKPGVGSTFYFLLPAL